MLLSESCTVLYQMLSSSELSGVLIEQLLFLFRNCLTYVWNKTHPFAFLKMTIFLFGWKTTRAETNWLLRVIIPCEATCDEDNVLWPED